MIIHSHKRPTTEYVYRYCGHSALEIAAVVSEAKDGIVERQYLAIRRHGELSASGSERFDTIPVTRRSYGPLTYVLLLPRGTDEG